MPKEAEKPIYNFIGCELYGFLFAQRVIYN